MKPLITIKKFKGLRYYTQITSYIYSIAVFIGLGLTAFNSGNTFSSAFALMGLIPAYYLYIALQLKQVEISQDITCVNDLYYETQHIELEFKRLPRVFSVICTILCDGFEVSKFVCSSALLGSISGTTPDEIQSVLRQAKGGIEPNKQIHISLGSQKYDITSLFILMIFTAQMIFMLAVAFFFIRMELKVRHII